MLPLERSMFDVCVLELCFFSSLIVQQLIYYMFDHNQPDYNFVNLVGVISSEWFGFYWDVYFIIGFIWLILIWSLTLTHLSQSNHKYTYLEWKKKFAYSFFTYFCITNCLLCCIIFTYPFDRWPVWIRIAYFRHEF